MSMHAWSWLSIPQYPMDMEPASDFFVGVVVSANVMMAGAVRRDWRPELQPIPSVRPKGCGRNSENLWSCSSDRSLR